MSAPRHGVPYGTGEETAIHLWAVLTGDVASGDIVLGEEAYRTWARRFHAR
jgi:hypothetical protein